MTFDSLILPNKKCFVDFYESRLNENNMNILLYGPRESCKTSLIEYMIQDFVEKYKNKFIFYDVGANYGIFTFLFGRLSVFTISFDPIKECIEYIKRGYIYKNILFVYIFSSYLFTLF